MRKTDLITGARREYGVSESDVAGWGEGGVSVSVGDAEVCESLKERGGEMFSMLGRLR